MCAALVKRLHAPLISSQLLRAATWNGPLSIAKYIPSLAPASPDACVRARVSRRLCYCAAASGPELLCSMWPPD